MYVPFPCKPGVGSSDNVDEADGKAIEDINDVVVFKPIVHLHSSSVSERYVNDAESHLPTSTVAACSDSDKGKESKFSILLNIIIIFH